MLDTLQQITIMNINPFLYPETHSDEHLQLPHKHCTSIQQDNHILMHNLTKYSIEVD